MDQQHWPSRIKGMRGQLRLNQQHFAALLGFTVRAVSRWEGGRVTPSGLGWVLLELLHNVVSRHNPSAVVTTLRETDRTPLQMVRVLTWLERSDAIKEPVQVWAPTMSTCPPPWSSRVASMRRLLAKSQQGFADVVGFTAAVVHRWERGRAVPSELSEIILEMLSIAVRGHVPSTIDNLVGTHQLVRVRALAWLERNPALPVVIPALLNREMLGPPPPFDHRWHRQTPWVQDPPTKPFDSHELIQSR
jgi:DNA-binding transcriptional regulator YiaG